jgi:hypothetical protein
VKDAVSRRRVARALLAGAILMLVAPPQAAKASNFSPHQLPGFEHVPWARLQGDVGRWVRYRVGNEMLEETSFMTLAVVERESDGGMWIEVRVGRVPEAQVVGGLAVRTLLRPAPGDEYESERVIVRMGGGKVVEIDLATVPPPEDDDDEPPVKQANVCVDPDSHACAAAEGQGMQVRRRPPETLLTAAGSMRVKPVEIRLEDGTVVLFRAAEAVPITGLVSMMVPDGTYMELDGVGDGAVATLPKEAELVAYENLSAVMGGGSAAIGATQRLGQLVNPDDALRHAASHGHPGRDGHDDDDGASASDREVSP